MTETAEQKKSRLETSNGIDLRNMVNQRKLNHGQIVVDGEGESVVKDKMVHTLNRRDRRKMIHQEKVKFRLEAKFREKIRARKRDE